MDVSAASLILKFPTDKIEIADVRLGGQNLTVQHTVVNGTLRVGWHDLLPFELAKDDTLFTLMVHLLGSITEGEQIVFGLVQDPLVELADGHNQVIPGAQLYINSIETPLHKPAREASDSNLGLRNIPNPFNQFTTISYTIPYQGKVILEVYDLLGRKMAEPINQIQAAGSYVIPVDLSNMLPGVYSATLRLSNTEKTLIQSIKIVNM
jgi:hypothetical protein